MLLNDDLKVVDRKYRFDGPQRAVIETLLSIHTPIPKGSTPGNRPRSSRWATARPPRGMLRFEKEKKTRRASPTDLVKVKVSGVLKAEGVVAGNFIKDGTYTVTGEQVFDTHTHEWTSSRWSVAVANDLANQAGRDRRPGQGDDDRRVSGRRGDHQHTDRRRSQTEALNWKGDFHVQVFPPDRLADLARRVRRGPGRGADVHQGRRADPPEELRRVPPAGRGRAVPAPLLSRMPPSGRATSPR